LKDKFSELPYTKKTKTGIQRTFYKIKKMNLTEEHIETIRKDFTSILTKEDFLNLLNYVKTIAYDDKCYPFKERQLNYHINPNHNNRRYYQFQISKKSGGERTINAPCKGLKEIQNCLNIIFQALYTPHKNAYGFILNKSIVDNAKKHIGNIYIYNIDLKDFFPSIDQARIWGRLQHPPFNLNKDRVKIASIIASLCCHEMEMERLNESENWEKVSKRVLPQGAPTSPVLTNIICERLDSRLTGVAKRFGLRYSRYADDITFSSMHNVYQKDSKFINELGRIIKEQGFAIRSSKTRLQKTGYRQEVTGLIVSDRVNVQQRYIKQLRKWLYYWETYGYDRTYTYFLPYYMADKGHVKKGKANMENVLSGKLEFLKMVKGYDNLTYLKLRKRFDKLVSQTKSSFITSILDIWERDGIEKAMEYYNKVSTPPAEVSIEKSTNIVPINDNTLPYRGIYLATYTINEFMEIESCDEISVGKKKKNDGTVSFYIIYLNEKEGQIKFGTVSKNFDFNYSDKENINISKVEGKDGYPFYILHNKSNKKKNSVEKNISSVENN